MQPAVEQGEDRDRGDGRRKRMRRAGDQQRAAPRPRRGPRRRARTPPRRSGRRRRRASTGTRVRNDTAASSSANGPPRAAAHRRGLPRRSSDDARGLPPRAVGQQRRVDAEHVADPVVIEGRLGRAVGDDPAVGDHHDPRDAARGEVRGRGGRRRSSARRARSGRRAGPSTSNWWRRSRWTVGSSSMTIGAAWATATRQQDELPLAERELAGVAADEAPEPDPLDRRGDRRPVGRPRARGTGPRAAAGRAPRPPRPAPRTAGSTAAGPRRSGGRPSSRSIAPSGGRRVGSRPTAGASEPGQQPKERRLAGAVRARRARPARPAPIARSTSRSTAPRAVARRSTPRERERAARSQLVAARGGAAGQEERRPDDAP